MTDGLSPGITSPDALELPCLYCLERGRPSDESHVVPAGFGPHANIVLSEGADCQRCNTWLGRHVEEGLVHLFHVELIRGIYQVPDRNGKTRDELQLRNGRIDFTREEMLHIELMGTGHTRKGEGSVTATLRSRRGNSGEQWRQSARALLKMGLALLYLERGAAEALAPTYDAVRRAILGDPYDGFMLIGPFDLQRWPDFELSLLFDLPGLHAAVRFRYGGLDLITDLALGAASDEALRWAREAEYKVMPISPRRAAKVLAT